jgi:hypothetical protein
MSKRLIALGQIFPFSVFRFVVRRLIRWRREKKYRLQRKRLEARYFSVPRPRDVAVGSRSLGDLPIVVINLPERSDRLRQFTDEMGKLGVTNFEVIPGVSGKALYPKLPGDFSGAIGCNLAHSTAVESPDWSKTDVLMVCEDDLEFLVSSSEIESLIANFLARKDLDVLCLAGRVRGPKIPIDDELYVVTGLVGQACYLIKPHMAQPLADLWRSGVASLARKRLSGKNDIIWNSLQTRNAFFGYPTRQIARQRESYSDIQGRVLPVQDST